MLAFVLYPLAVLMQVTPTPDPASVDILAFAKALVTAWNGRAWPLFIALVLGAGISILKQRWTWFAAKIPSSALPAVAMLLAVLSVSVAQIAAGVPWVQAILMGLMAGALPTWTHQTVVEGMRQGKEPVPASKKVAAQTIPPPPPGAGPSVSDVLTVGPEIRFKKTDPPAPPDTHRETLRWPRALLVAMCLSCVMLVTGTVSCTAAQWQTFADSATRFSTYVTGFLQLAQFVWMQILPTLGDKAAAANQRFNQAYVTAENALATMGDVIQAATLAQKPLDIEALMVPVKDAITQITAIVNEYRQPAGPSLGGQVDELSAHARAIAVWR
jgi:hypothetical protein